MYVDGGGACRTHVANGMCNRLFRRTPMRAAAPELLPWGTHAYVISAGQAERMARLADLLVSRSAHPVDAMHTTTWQLDGEDVKIDHFLSLVYSNLTIASERSRRGWRHFA